MRRNHQIWCRVHKTTFRWFMRSLTFLYGVCAVMDSSAISNTFNMFHYPIAFLIPFDLACKMVLSGKFRDFLWEVILTVWCVDKSYMPKIVAKSRLLHYILGTIIEEHYIKIENKKFSTYVYIYIYSTTSCLYLITSK